MQAFNQVKELLQAGIAAYGVWLIIKGLVKAGSGWSNHQSTEMRDGGADIIGGGLICLAAGIVSMINL